MIWLKENQKLVGYVPILKKEYSEKEIRQMSKYHCYYGWSELSRFVMKIQGIGFACHYDSANTLIVPAQRLVDICFCFNFECFLVNDYRMKTYISQIFNVFENLTLYKIKEFSKKDGKEQIEQAKNILAGIVSTRTLTKIDEDFVSILHDAENSLNNLYKLQKMFEDNGYILDKSNLFANINESIKKTIYERSEKKAILEMID